MKIRPLRGHCAPCYVCPAHLHADRRTEPYSNTVSVHKRALLSSIDLTVVLKTGTVTGRIQYTLSSFRVKPIYVNQHTVNQHTDMAACLCAWRLPPDLWLPALPLCMAAAPRSLVAGSAQKDPSGSARDSQTAPKGPDILPPEAYCTCQMSLLYSSIVRSEEK